MTLIGKKISQSRKSKGFTQEELADLSKVNLRTIQRIENNQNEPRGKTLDLICDVLQLDKTDLQELSNPPQNNKIGAFIINTIFLGFYNLGATLLVGYLTLPNEANINSRVGAVFLSFFVPFFIVYYSSKMKATERLLKFGTGYLAYPILLIYAQGFRNGLGTGFRTWLLSCLVISIGTLFYGDFFLRKEK